MFEWSNFNDAVIWHNLNAGGDACFFFRRYDQIFQMKLHYHKDSKTVSTIERFV
jgi:hypothetical protein